MRWLFIVLAVGVATATVAGGGRAQDLTLDEAIGAFRACGFAHLAAAGGVVDAAAGATAALARCRGERTTIGVAVVRMLGPVRGEEALLDVEARIEGELAAALSQRQ